MFKSIKVILIILVSLLVIAVAAAVVVIYTVDPNDYKTDISRTVKEYTGRNLNFSGDIEFSLYPILGLKVGPVELGNAEGFESDIMAGINEVDVSIRLLPLFSGKLEIGMIVLDGLTLNLEKNEDGVFNWNDLIKARDGESSKGQGDNGPADKEFTLAGFSLQGVQVSHADIKYKDFQMGTVNSLENVNITIGHINGFPGRFPFEIDFDLKADSLPQVLHPKLSCEIGIDPDAAKIAIDNLKFSVLNLSGSGKLSARQENGDNTFDMEVHLAEMSLRQLLTDVGIELPKSGDSHILDSVSGDIAVSGTGSSILLRSAAFKFGNSTLKSSGSFSMEQGRKSFDGDFLMHVFSLRKLLGELGIKIPETSDHSSISEFSTDISFSGDDSSIAINDAVVKFDDSTLKVQGEITDFSYPSIKFVADIDTVDVDRYLPPESAKKVKDKHKAATVPDRHADPAGKEPDLSLLKKFDLDAQISIDRMKVKKLPIENILVGVSLLDGDLAISPASFNFSNGISSSAISLSVADDSPAWQVKGFMKNIKSGPVISAFAGDKYLSGNLSADYDLSGKGLSAASVSRTVSGNVSFDLAQGVVFGFDLVKMIIETVNEVQGYSVEEPESDDFKFASINGSAVLKNGLISNDDLSVESEFLNMEGEGWADLGKDQVDYTAVARIVGVVGGEVGEDIDLIKGIPLPVNISGKLGSPRIGVDSKALGKALIKGAAVQGLSILGKALKDKSDPDSGDEEGDASDDVDSLSDLIQGLF